MQSWQDFAYTASDGLKLAGRQYGWENRDAVPVVCLAGLSRNSRDFHALGTYLSAHADTKRRVLTLDYRGRGRSAYDRNHENYNPLTEADDVIQGMVAAGLGHAHMIGTSRGGLIIMILAAMRPGIIASAVLNDVGPELGGAGLVRIKKMLETGHSVRDWAEAARLISEAGRNDFPARSMEEWDRQAHMIYREADPERDGKAAKKGGLVRDFDPALVRTLAAIDLDTPLPTMWDQFRGLAGMPVLTIRGALSHVLEEATLERMQAIHPAMETVTIADAGHAPDAGDPALASRIAAFLDRADRQSRHG